MATIRYCPLPAQIPYYNNILDNYTLPTAFLRPQPTTAIWIVIACAHCQLLLLPAAAHCPQQHHYPDSLHTAHGQLLPTAHKNNIIPGYCTLPTASYCPPPQPKPLYLFLEPFNVALELLLGHFRDWKAIDDGRPLGRPGLFTGLFLGPCLLLRRHLCFFFFGSEIKQ
jgi:hypothetical protein